MPLPLLHRASGFPAFMSRRRMLSLILRFSAISLVFGLFACGSSDSTVQRSPAPKQLSVVTTFLPITMFTEAVAGECADVTALIPPSLGPHDFQASPSDLATLSKASVLVQNGLGIEEFLDDLVRSAANPDLVVIDSSRGVATIKPAEDSRVELADDHHDHMVCLETGKVIEFHDEMIEKRQESIASEMGYEIVDHSMVLYVKPIK